MICYNLLSISKKAQRIKGLIRPYISQKAIKLLKFIIMIIWAYSGPHFNPKAIQSLEMPPKGKIALLAFYSQ